MGVSLIDVGAYSFSPEAVDWHGYAVKPVDCLISAYATFIAFSLTNVKATSFAPILESLASVLGDHPSERYPAVAELQILADDELYCPFDLRLEGQRQRPYRDAVADSVLPPSSLTAMIAFDPFVGEVNEFRVIFLPPFYDPNGHSTSVEMRYTGAHIAATTRELDSLPEILARSI